MLDTTSGDVIQSAPMEKKEGRRVYAKGDGIRRRYHDMLDPGRFLFPRRGLVHHAESWFLSTAPLARPTFGVYAMGAFAEDLMWRARFGRRGRRPTLEAAARFFASTRRALQNVLSTYRIGRRLTAAQTARLRRTVERLVEEARELTVTL